VEVELPAFLTWEKLTEVSDQPRAVVALLMVSAGL